LVIVGCWGCAGDLENPERFGFLLDNDAEIPPPPECMTSLFQARCNTTACHGAGSPQVDLVSPGLADRLVGKASTSTLCRPRVYVPMEGEESLLLEKLDAVPECGIRMPIGPPLEAADLSCVSGWVKAVADASGGGS
jgi:hypothetical protein